MVKYFINNFLSVKVSFANEMSQICRAVNVDYASVANLALYDKRIGESHLQVPGPDGDFGFGGKCFPKDLNAMITHSQQNNVDAKMLNAAWDKNMEVRQNKDWLNIEGAVTKENKNG